MENTDQYTEDPNKAPKPVEHHYEEHKSDPGPAPEAVEEKNNKGAGPAMKWIIPILVVILMIYWLVFRK